MKKTRQLLGLAAACALVLTTSFAGYADPVTYDQTAEAAFGGQQFNFDAETPIVFPGDSIYGPVTIYLGAENAAAGTAAEMKTDEATGVTFWKNSSSAVYSVTDVTPASDGSAEGQMVQQVDEAGNPVVDEAGNPVMVPAEGTAPAAKAYELDTVGYAVEVISGKSEGWNMQPDTSAASLIATAADGTTAEVVPDAKYYADGTAVTLTADPAPDGQQFTGWTVSKLQDDGTLAPVDDLAALNLTDLTADKLSADGMTFTIGATDKLLVFTANYGAAAPAETEAPATEAAAEAADPNAAPADAVDPSAAPADGSQAAADAIVVNPASDGTAAEAADADESPSPDASQAQAAVVLVSGVDSQGNDTTITADPVNQPTLPITTAQTNAQGQVFDHWEVSDQTAVLADAKAFETTVTFQSAPAANISITAVYADASAAPAGDTAQEASQDAADATTDGQNTTGQDGQNPASSDGQNPAPSDGQNPAPTDGQNTDPAPVPTDTYTINTEGTGGDASQVTLTVAGQPVQFGAPIDAGKKVTATAADRTADGRQFSGWTAKSGEQDAKLMNDGQEVDLSKSSITFDLTNNLTLEPSYQEINFKISSVKGDGNQYTHADSLPTEAKAGAAVNVTLKNTTANLSVVVVDSSKNQVPVNDDNKIADDGSQTFSFTMPASDVTLTYTGVENYAKFTVTGGVLTDGNTTGSFVAGGNASVKAQTPAGKVFTGWTVGGDGAGLVSGDTSKAETTFTVKSPLTASANVILTANYKDVTYKLTVKSGSGSGDYAVTTPAQITADAAQPGYQFSGWTLVSGTGTFANQKAATTTFTLGSDAQIQANYEPIPYKITVKSGKGSGSYTVGQDFDIEPNFPEAGKEFDKWSVTSGKLDIDDTSSYYATATAKASDATVTALYKNGPSPDNNTITGLQNDMEYLKSSTLTFNAVGAGMDNQNPNPGDYRYRPTGYQIGSVTGSWSKAPYTTSMAINQVGDYTLTVTFARDVYDGSSWNADGTTDSKSIVLHIVNTLSVATGDSSPIIPLAVAAIAALVVIVAVVVIRRRRR